MSFVSQPRQPYDDLAKAGIFSFLDLFFKEIDFLVSLIKTKKEAEKLDSLLPHLFRRWYYTKISLPKGVITPYLAVKGLKDRLPKYTGAEILILPLIHKFSLKGKRIEQLAFQARPVKAKNFPILQDFYYHEKLKEKPLYQENDYKQLFSSIRKYFSSQKKKISQNLPLKEAKKLSHLILGTSLFYWWNENLFLSRAFSLDEFNALFFEFLSQAKKDYFEVDLVFDFLLRRLSKEFPLFKVIDPKEDEGLVREKIRKNKQTKMAYFSYFRLGQEFDRFFLTPMSTYLWALEIWWEDRELMLKDWQLCFKSIIDEHFSIDGLSFLYLPPSFFKLNELGKRLF